MTGSGRWLFVGLALLVGGLPASAQLTGFRVEVFDSPQGVVHQFFIDFQGQYTGSQLLLCLDSGSIHQDLNPGIGPPPIGLLSVQPESAFDTFVAQGSATADGPFGNPSPGGGAVDLGGAPAAIFDAAKISQSWNPAPGRVIVDQTDFLVAQVTLSPDASGTFAYLGSANGVISTFDGTLPIPEPATGATIALGGLVLMHRRLTRLRAC